MYSLLHHKPPIILNFQVHTSSLTKLERFFLKHLFLRKSEMSFSFDWDLLPVLLSSRFDFHIWGKVTIGIMTLKWRWGEGGGESNSSANYGKNIVNFEHFLHLFLVFLLLNLNKQVFLIWINFSWDLPDPRFILGDGGTEDSIVALLNRNIGWDS